MNILEYCLSKIAPNKCLFCDSSGRSVCNYCYGDVVPCLSACYHCYKAAEDFETCKVAKNKGAPEKVFFYTAYNETSKKIILAMKNESKRDIPETLSRYLDDVVPHLTSDWVIVPITTISRHIRERGFDHTKKIAESFANSRKLRSEILIDRLNNSVQKNKTKQIRYKQASDTYSLKNRGSLPKKVLLVDDMVTSGATIEAVTALLKKAGVKTVWAAVFARKL